MVSAPRVLGRNARTLTGSCPQTALLVAHTAARRGPPAHGTLLPSPRAHSEVQGGKALTCK